MHSACVANGGAFAQDRARFMPRTSFRHTPLFVIRKFPQAIRLWVDEP
jgi:hypothetical protein